MTHANDVRSEQQQSPLAAARNSYGWSQSYVASLIEVTALTVSRWESGRILPRSFYRQRLCELFRMSEEELGIAPAPPSSPTTPLAAVTVGEVFPVVDPIIPLPTTVLGRDQTLSEIREELCTSLRPSIAMYGLPGVGKTTLLNTLAHDSEVRRHYPTILWAGLGLRPNHRELLQRWASLLLPRSSSFQQKRWDLEGLQTALRNVIGLQPVLLLIDDAWTLEDAQAFKVGGARCAYLLTTRDIKIASYFASEVVQLSELDEESSLLLLTRLAPDVVPKHRSVILDLIRATGGLPLTLTLMGNWLRVAAASGQPRRIEQAILQLQSAEARLEISEPRGPLERHTSLPRNVPLSLQALIAVSDQQLDEPTRSALYALSVFPSKPASFSEEAALYVANCSTRELDQLVDAGLLESGSSSSERYALHPSIADYAAVHLDRSEDVIIRLATYYIGYLEHLNNSDTQWLLDADSKNIQQALSMTKDQNLYDRLFQLFQISFKVSTRAC
jgi:transcriptional regulator with XRE-family HTH domain